MGTDCQLQCNRPRVKFAYDPGRRSLFRRLNKTAWEKTAVWNFGILFGGLILWFCSRCEKLAEQFPPENDLAFSPTELDIAYEYMKDHLFELQRKIWRRDWSSQLYTHNLSSCEIVAWKKYKPVYYADKFGMYSIKALSSRPCYLRVTFHDKIVSENAGFQFREIMNLYVPFWQRENIDFFAQRINFCICLLTYRK